MNPLAFLVLAGDSFGAAAFLDDPFLSAQFFYLLVHGMKAYGSHIWDRVMPIPFVESLPRVPHENFYYHQEDYCRAKQAGHSWGWTIFRPAMIAGDAIGSNMNSYLVLGVFAAARDVTEQKQASQYARSLIEASLDPLVTISPEGKITDVNAALADVTGVTRERLIGTDFSDYFTEPQKAREGYRLGNQQVIEFNAAAVAGDLQLQNLTLRNGFSTEYGGCITANTAGSIALDHVLIQQCLAGSGGYGAGGGLYVRSGAVAVTDSTFDTNSAGNGAAINIDIRR